MSGVTTVGEGAVGKAGALPRAGGGVAAVEGSHVEVPFSRVLSAFFAAAQRYPRVMLALEPVFTVLATVVSGEARRNSGMNLCRLRGRRAGVVERLRFTRAVLGNFYRTVIDVMALKYQSPETLRARIDSVTGEPRYLERRRQGNGAVFVTAHLGSFEVGLAALAAVEGKIHVVFKRDPCETFEGMRSAFRGKLGVREAAIDEGWTSLMQIRAALEANEVIVIQGDRAFPGQRSMPVAVASGTLRLPIGPVTLARLSGAAIVPVFTTRSRGGRFQVHILEPIEVADVDDGAALGAIGRAIEAMVTRYPEQWLVLHRAFVEDQAS